MEQNCGFKSKIKDLFFGQDLSKMTVVGRPGFTQEAEAPGTNAAAGKVCITKVQASFKFWNFKVQQEKS